MRTNCFCPQTFWTPSAVQDILAKFLRHPGIPPSKPKENKLSKEGTNFFTPTPSRGRPPSHPAVSGPKKLVFVLFFWHPARLLERGFRASAPNKEKNWKNIGFGLPRKIGKKSPKNRKYGPQTLFLSNFPSFRLIFSYFRGETKTNIFPIFFL